MKTLFEQKESLSPEELAQRDCDRLNAEVEKLPDIEGFSCPECGDKGGKYVVDEDGEPCWRNCPHCLNVRDAMYILKQCGLSVKTFDSYRVYSNTPWQVRTFQTIKKYATDSTDKWLFVGGQSGCGKTHLCTAAVREIAIRENVSVGFMKWVEDSRNLKSYVLDREYIDAMTEFKRPTLLYIDDLFKGGISAADLKIAYEIIDYRYRNKLRTIISSEYFLNEITDKDEALGGRIREMIGNYQLAINRDRTRNHRFRQPENII